MRHCYAIYTAFRRRAPLAHGRPRSLDFEGFASIRLSEWESIERIHELAEFMQEHEEVGALILDDYCGDIEDATRALEY